MSFPCCTVTEHFLVLFFFFQIALGECYRVRFCGVHSRAFIQNLYVSCLYKELGSFLFGCCVGQSLTNMAKLSVGRLRPNFLSVCNITYVSINCSPGSYVSQVTCRQPEQKLVEEARCVIFVAMLGLFTQGGRLQVCILEMLMCNFMHHRVYRRFLSGSPFFPAMPLLRCTPCSIWL